jgi:hypothetical protein
MNNRFLVVGVCCMLLLFGALASSQQTRPTSNPSDELADAKLSGGGIVRLTQVRDALTGQIESVELRVDGSKQILWRQKAEPTGSGYALFRHLALAEVDKGLLLLVYTIRESTIAEFVHVESPAENRPTTASKTLFQAGSSTGRDFYTRAATISGGLKSDDLTIEIDTYDAIATGGQRSITFDYIGGDWVRFDQISRKK